jgi:hypothetical protein
MIDLTQDQIDTCRAELEVLRHLEKASGQCIQASKDAPKGSTEALAQVLMSGAIHNVMQERLDNLLGILDIDLNVDDPVAKYTALALALDGNRRVGKK